MTTEWVNCPICNEPDMRCERDPHEPELTQVFCCNLGCPSNVTTEQAHDVRPLTSEDKRMIAYFILEKDDIERWTGYEDKKELIRIHLPELYEALRLQKLYNKTVRQLAEEIQDEC